MTLIGWFMLVKLICVYNYLSKDKRNTLENNLFRPFADYIIILEIKI